ncbi:MAG TPA: His/Gly/Thr/Pro-type tRNA ligase C-terminal domain-containing protein, partial [Mucilaginibacter sp.]|nr:His/Gly/Thr/Pro-type tRNA ligase C-terminal domain-containing protein [Mucilaginibacter sp.]
ELKGVPVRVAIGSRDMQNGTVELARRDTKTKETVAQEGLANTIEALLAEIQTNIYQKAAGFRVENTTEVNDYEEFKRLLDEKPGFLSAHWDGTSETEQRIKDETKATIRCIPLNNKQEEGKCILTGKPSTQRVLFARAY